MNDETTLPDREYPGFWADQEPDRLAIVVHGSEKSMTFQELHDEAARIANLFRSLGLAPADHVAFCLENRIEFLPLAWGAIYAGLTYTAISSRLTTDEVMVKSSVIVFLLSSSETNTSSVETVSAYELVKNVKKKKIINIFLFVYLAKLNIQLI